MKRKKSLLILIVLTFSLLFLISNVKGFTDIEYEFQNDVLYSNDNPSLNLFNVREQQTYNGTYIATDSFTNEIDGTLNTDIDFIDSFDVLSGIQAEIKADFLNHKKVISFIDVSTVNQLVARNLFTSSQVSGSYDYWILFSNTSSRFDIRTMTSETVSIFFGVLDGSLFYFDGSINNITEVDSNEWIYIRTDFECGGGGHEGLASDTFFVYVNSVKFGSFPFWNNAVNLDKLEFDSSVEGQIVVHFDAIGYDWQAYGIASNFAPDFEVLEGNEGLLETDKYEFALLNVNTPTPLGAVSSIGLWNFVDTGEGFTQVFNDGNLDRKVELIVGVGIGTARMTRTSLSINNNFVDVNIGFESSFPTSTHGILTMRLESSDQNTITAFKVDLNTNDLSYFSNNGTWIVLRSDIALEAFYDVNMFLDYNYDLVKLELFKNDIFQENYIFEMVSTGKSGLFEIDIEASIGAGESLNQFEIDYVGVYRDGASWHGEIGVITTPISLPFHFERHYLYSIDYTGGVHDGVVDGSYVVGESSFQNVLNFSTIPQKDKSGLETFNLYEHFFANISNANLVYTVSGQDISINSINIEGSKLVLENDEHFLIFSSGGLEPLDNYFFVDGNILKFIHNTSLDDVNEFIQAEFDIIDKTTVDTAIVFTSNIDINAFGFFRLKYLDTSQIIQIDNTLNIKRVLLNTDENIESFIILISDTDDNSIEGITTGLVKDIFLLDINTAIVSIVSLNLIEMFVPLIIILLPTLAISGIFGKFLVVPFFMFMSLVLAITSIIPIWLFFVIVISNSLFIFFFKNEKRDDL